MTRANGDEAGVSVDGEDFGGFDSEFRALLKFLISEITLPRVEGENTHVYELQIHELEEKRIFFYFCICRELIGKHLWRYKSKIRGVPGFLPRQRKNIA